MIHQIQCSVVEWLGTEIRRCYIKLDIALQSSSLLPRPPCHIHPLEPAGWWKLNAAEKDCTLLFHNRSRCFFSASYHIPHSVMFLEMHDKLMKHLLSRVSICPDFDKVLDYKDPIGCCFGHYDYASLCMVGRPLPAYHVCTLLTTLPRPPRTWMASLGSPMFSSIGMLESTMCPPPVL